MVVKEKTVDDYDMKKWVDEVRVTLSDFHLLSDSAFGYPRDNDIEGIAYSLAESALKIFSKFGDV